MKDYIDAALTTKSDAWHGQMVGMIYFQHALREFIDAANHLDAIKKTLFYGKKLYQIAENHTWGGVNLEGIVETIPADIIHAIVGLSTETGELCEALLEAINGAVMGKGVTALDTTNLKEESGDLLWYLAVMFKELETDFGTEGKRNIAKLMKRFPNGFTQDNALVRDLIAERATLEGAAA